MDNRNDSKPQATHAKLSLRKTRIRALNVRSGVQTGGAPCTTDTTHCTISCIVGSKPPV